MNQTQRRNTAARMILRSGSVGAAAAVLIGTLLFVLAPRTNAVSAYLFPGVTIGGAISRFVPSALVYWFEPEGGPGAFLLIVLVSSFFFWSAVFGGVHGYLVYRKYRRLPHG